MIAANTESDAGVPESAKGAGLKIGFLSADFKMTKPFRTSCGLVPSQVQTALRTSSGSSSVRILPPALNLLAHACALKRDRMIVVDIETTGMEPKKNSILSIGALDFENPENTFYGECRSDDGAEVSNIALKINGFTKEEINDPKKPTSEHLLKDFVKWAKKTKDRTIAGDNIWFDVGFLEINFKKHKLKWIFKKKYIELHEMSPLLTGLPWSLDAVLYMVGVPPRNRAHNALNDAELTAEAMARIAAGKSIIKKFKKHPIPDVFKNEKMRAVAGI